MTHNSASNRLGRFIQTSFGGENVRAFVPPALPPDPPIQIETLLSKLSKADRAIVQLFKIDREKIANTGERSSSVLRIHELLQTSPFITAPKAVEKTRLTMPTINAILDSLQRLGIIEEITGRKRGRVYAYRNYMNLLSEGVQPT